MKPRPRRRLRSKKLIIACLRLTERSARCSKLRKKSRSTSGSSVNRQRLASASIPKSSNSSSSYAATDGLERQFQSELNQARVIHRVVNHSEGRGVEVCAG